MKAVKKSCIGLNLYAKLMISKYYTLFKQAENFYGDFSK